MALRPWPFEGLREPPKTWMSRSRSSAVSWGPVISELQVAGLHHRYPELADELLESGAVLPLLHTSGMEVDLVLAGSGLEALALSRAERMLLDGISVPVAQATDLVVMKVLAGRGKDLDDVRALLASEDVDVAEARDLLGQLEQALDQSDLLPRLDDALRERKRR